MRLIVTSFASTTSIPPRECPFQHPRVRAIRSTTSSVGLFSPRSNSPPYVLDTPFWGENGSWGYPVFSGRLLTARPNAVERGRANFSRDFATPRRTVLVADMATRYSWLWEATSDNTPPDDVSIGAGMLWNLASWMARAGAVTGDQVAVSLDTDTKSVRLASIRGALAERDELAWAALPTRPRRRGGPADRARVAVAAREFFGALGQTLRADSRASHHAWNEGAACPLGVGLPPLAAVRSDLPLRPEYHELSVEARLVLL